MQPPPPPPISSPLYLDIPRHARGSHGLPQLRSPLRVKFVPVSLERDLPRAERLPTAHHRLPKYQNDKIIEYTRYILKKEIYNK